MSASCRRISFLILLTVSLFGCGDGGSDEAPILRNTAEYNAAIERAQQISAPVLAKADTGEPLTQIDKTTLAESATLFESIVAFQPTNWVAHSSCGRVEQLLDRHEKAIQHFEQALRSGPKSPTDEAKHLLAVTHLFLSDSQFAQQHFNLADAEARQALALDPNNPVFLGALASALVQEGKATEARSILTRAIKIDRNAPRLKNLRRLISLGSSK